MDESLQVCILNLLVHCVCVWCMVFVCMQYDFNHLFVLVPYSSAIIRERNHKSSQGNIVLQFYYTEVSSDMLDTCVSV